MDDLHDFPSDTREISAVASDRLKTSGATKKTLAYKLSKVNGEYLPSVGLGRGSHLFLFSWKPSLQEHSGFLLEEDLDDGR